VDQQDYQKITAHGAVICISSKATELVYYFGMNLGNQTLEFNFEKAIELLGKHMPIAKNKRKPVVMHAIRVGMYLYEKGYSNEIVIGGLLHDIFEQTDISHDVIIGTFGNDVYQIVLANSQNKEIDETIPKWQDMVNRCVKAGKDALIVKAADVLDSYHFYQAVQNPEEIQRSVGIGKFILENLPDGIEDSIFEELEQVR